jgi:hypothetical protein
MEKEKSTWQVLSQINCNEHTEKKNGLTYLSWAWAWGIVKEKYPDANYEVIKYNGCPYLYDEVLGYLVTTRVTINGETIEMLLPVMDNGNRAKKANSYKVMCGKKGQQYEVLVEAATMFDINTSIMRCLTKNLAMFGLGHYIYAGEDLPAEIVKETPVSVDTPLQPDTLNAIKECKSVDELKKLWVKRNDLHKNDEFKKLVGEKKKSLEEPVKKTEKEEIIAQFEQAMDRAGMQKEEEVKVTETNSLSSEKTEEESKQLKLL